MAVETGLEGKPWYVAAAVAVGLAGVLVFAVNYFKLKDMRLQIQRKQTQLSEHQNKINEARAAERSLPQFREEVRRLEIDLEKLLRILPTNRNTEDLLRRIRSLTEQGNFDLLSFRPGNFAPQDFYSEWPIRIQLEGTYHNLALFFDRMSRFSRIINIDSLRVVALKQGGPRSGPQSPHTIDAQFTAKTFLYQDDSETGGGV